MCMYLPTGLTQEQIKKEIEDLDQKISKYEAIVQELNDEKRTRLFKDQD